MIDIKKKNSKLSEKFEKTLNSPRNVEIIKFIDKFNDIFFVISQDSILGFLKIKSNDLKIFIRVYLTSNFNEILLPDFLKAILQFSIELKSRYLFLSHCFDSKNILNELNGIDRMFRYEIDPDVVLSHSLISPKSKVNTQVDDIDQLVHLHEICYSDDPEYMQSNWQKMLGEIPRVSFPKIKIADYKNDLMIGCCIGYYLPEKNKKYIYSICVLPDYRRKGIAESLIQSFLNTEPLSSCYLTVYESATAAVILYDKIGFKRMETVSVVLNLQN